MCFYSRLTMAVAVLASLPLFAESPFTITGRVVVPDGSPPPEPAVIERHCPGRRNVETKTDSRGRFSFRIRGDANPPLIDATVSRPREAGTTRGAVGGGGYRNLLTPA